MIIRKTSRFKVRAELDQVIAEYTNSLLCLWVKTNSVKTSASLGEIEHFKYLFPSLRAKQPIILFANTAIAQL